MDTNPIIYHDPNAYLRSPVQGDILVASPFMKEYFFARSVVLLLDNPTDGGQLGLVLNRKSKVSLQDIFPALSELPVIDVYGGGPVGQDRLFMLHSLPEVFGGSLEVAPGIYVGGGPESIVRYILDGGDLDGKVRFFLGYSGWGKDQLSSEIKAQTWAIGRPSADVNYLSGRGGSYWKKVVEALGPEYRGWLNIPLDPSLN
ncbi:MAG: YqgE/AlgH family protein [Muribaculaceae bacterium]|nr:YqgE/AlgH family protein [Muribaculaceae bacterium]